MLNNPRTGAGAQPNGNLTNQSAAARTETRLPHLPHFCCRDATHDVVVLGYPGTTTSVDRQLHWLDGADSVKKRSRVESKSRCQMKLTLPEEIRKALSESNAPVELQDGQTNRLY